MEKRYCPDKVCKEAMAWANAGFSVVRLHGVAEDGACTCIDGHTCGSKGKHPVDKQWQFTSTCDEERIAMWFEDPAARWNIGVHLGPKSGVIDVEADNDEAIAALKRYGIDAAETVRWKGSRGPHALFVYEDDFPPVGVMKVDGIEVRVGGGDKAAQSAIPGSLHASGVVYDYIPGFSIDDVKPARLPPEFKAAILAETAKKATGCAARARESLEGEQLIGPGNRHDFLLGVAADQLYKERYPDERAKKRVLKILRSLNQTECRPPKGDSELVAIVNDCFAFYRKERDQAAGDPWERAGLRRTGNDWQPGQWRATCVHSDPRRYRLTVPAPDGSGLVYVNLNAEEWLNPNKVARKMLAATGTVNMCDPSPKKWATVWSGFSVRNDGGQWEAKRGLSAQLLENPYITHEYPPPELSRAATVAGLLYGHLAQVRRPTDEKDDKASNSGSAKWRYSDGRPELCFNWNAVWTEINESAETRVTGEEKQDLLEKLLKEVGIKEFPFTQAGSSRKRQYRWTDETLRILARLAGLEDAQ